MVTIHAISGRTLALGREGENLARQIVFDSAAWREAYGQGTVSLIAKRHGDAEPYPCNITVDGDTVTWPITSADTPYFHFCPGRNSSGMRPMRLANSTVPVSRPSIWPCATSSHSCPMRSSA